MTQGSASNRIRDEAHQLLGLGLMAVLAQHGEVHVVGSYALDLMTWRDLDVHLVREDVSVEDFFELGWRIASLLRPHRMHFRDETTVATKGLPRGLYWGVYLGDERAGAWKIDVWLTNRAGFEPTREFGDRLASRLTDENRRIILSIKEASWRHPEYRRGFTSSDIYAAVLDRGVRDIPGFWSHLKMTKGITASE